MNIIDNSGTGLAALGRNEDRLMAHVAPGEMVVPPVISDNTRAIIRKEMAAVGLDPNQYEVGQGMSINPITGQAEFGFLKKIAKSVKKVVKKIAPVAAVIPGPWQPFAAVYQKGAAALKLAKGEGGLGEIMTLAAGGNQALFGKEGAIEAIKSGTGILDPTKLGDAFKNIGQVAKLDAAGNIVKDAAGNVVTEFSPLAYGSNVLQGIASDQQQGYGGLLGGTGQKFDVTTGQLVGSGGAGFNPFMRQATPTTVTAQSGDNLTKIAEANNTTVQAIMDANPNIESADKIFAGQTIKIPGSTSPSLLSRLTGLGEAKTPGIIKSAGDALGLGGASGLSDFYGGSGTGTGGFGGIDPKMAGLALLYGKVVKDAAKKTEGGLTDIRQSKRPDLNPAPVFAGFDLGVRKQASFGGPIGYGRQQFNQGREVQKSDADYFGMMLGKPPSPQFGMMLGKPPSPPAPNPNILQELIDGWAEVTAQGGQVSRDISPEYIRQILQVSGRRENDPALNEMLQRALKKEYSRKKFAVGGVAELDMRQGGESVGPGTGTSDDIPAMLSDGEFVMTAAANNGAGGFKINKTKKGLELIASSKPNRKNGVNVMNQLMNTFEKYNKSGSMA